METKVCTRCKIEKYISEFYLEKRGKFGVRGRCMICEKQVDKEYYLNNREKIIKRKVKSNNKCRKIRKQIDPTYKLSCNLRRRQLLAIQGKCKYGKTFDLVGCTPEFLRVYIESKFADGMSWDNYGYYGWHIDHIRPCSSFDLSNPSKQKECFHYTNLQPLWAKDNFKKSDK